MAWLLLTNPQTPGRLRELRARRPRRCATRRTAPASPLRLWLLDAPIDVATSDQMAQRLLELAAHGRAAVAMGANAHTLTLAQEQPAYRALLQQAEVIFADGQGVVWAARWCGLPASGDYRGQAGARRIERANFLNIYEALLAACARRGARCYVLGGRPGIAERATQALARRWPGLAVVGAHDGYFSEAEAAAVAAEIRRAAPDLVLVGLGSPRQETWAMRYREAAGARLYWCVGASLEILAGEEPATPRWMQRAGVEWCFRLLRHPRRFWRRYLLGLPRFVWLVLRWRWQRWLDARPAPET